MGAQIKRNRWTVDVVISARRIFFHVFRLRSDDEPVNDYDSRGYYDHMEEAELIAKALNEEEARKNE